MSRASEEAAAYVKAFADRWHIGGEQLTELYGLAGRLGLLMSQDVVDRCTEILERAAPPPIRVQHQSWCTSEILKDGTCNCVRRQPR